jgi:hypothetical protein
MSNQDWQQQAVALLETGTVSRRNIAEMVGKPRSTVLDFLRAYDGFKDEHEEAEEGDVTHLVIPDTQMRPGISTEYLRWIGEYIVRKKPDVIVHLGDHADMPSLSSYDKGKRSAEGKRVQADIEASIEGMEVLLKPLRDLQMQQSAAGEKMYMPRMVILYGNHEDRINRHIDLNPEMHGFLGLEDLKYEEFGWETVPFLTPINIDGVSYCHYFPNVMTGKPLTGTAQNMLKTIGESFTMGHRQLLDVSTRFLPSSGKQQWGMVCGAAYVHEEHYKGKQGNHHWRGIVVKHRVKNGSYDPLFISMDWLESEYGK